MQKSVYRHPHHNLIIPMTQSTVTLTQTSLSWRFRPCRTRPLRKTSQATLTYPSSLSNTNHFTQHTAYGKKKKKSLYLANIILPISHNTSFPSSHYTTQQHPHRHHVPRQLNDDSCNSNMPTNNPIRQRNSNIRQRVAHDDHNHPPIHGRRLDLHSD